MARFRIIQWTPYTSNKRQNLIGIFTPTGWLTSLNILCSFFCLSTPRSSEWSDHFQRCNQNSLRIYAFPLVCSVTFMILWVSSWYRIPSQRDCVRPRGGYKVYHEAIVGLMTSFWREIRRTAMQSVLLTMLLI